MPFSESHISTPFVFFAPTFAYGASVAGNWTPAGGFQFSLSGSVGYGLLGGYELAPLSVNLAREVNSSQSESLPINPVYSSDSADDAEYDSPL